MYFTSTIIYCLTNNAKISEVSADWPWGERDVDGQLKKAAIAQQPRPQLNSDDAEDEEDEEAEKKNVTQHWQRVQQQRNENSQAYKRHIQLSYTPCLKNCAKLFLSELLQISTNFDNFWQKDGKEAKIMWGALTFHLN